METATPPSPPSQSPQKRSSFGLGTLLLVVVGISVAKVGIGLATRKAGDGSGKKHYSDSELKEEASKGNYVPILERTAAEVNNTLPRTINQGTTLDSVSAGPGAVMTYNYTLFTVAKQEVTQAEIDAFRPKLIELYKTHEDMKLYRDGNVEIRHNYHDKNRQLITTVAVSPKDF